MKYSLSIAAVILAVTCWIGWGNHREMAALRGECQQLRAEMLAAETTGSPGSRPSGGHRVRQDENHINRDEYATLIRRIGAAKMLRGLEGQAQRDALELEFSEKLRALGASEFKALMQELLADPTSGRTLIWTALFVMVKQYPREALPLVLEYPDLQANGNILQVLLPSLAKIDPLEAVDWIRQNGYRFPGFPPDEIVYDWIAEAAAEKDRVLAIRLASELDIRSPEQVLANVISRIDSPADRGAVFSAYRELLASQDDPRLLQQMEAAGYSAFLKNIAKEGFSPASEWMRSTLSQEELNTLIGPGIASSVRASDLPQWIAWIGQGFPTELSTPAIAKTIGDWGRTDPQAAGDWLDRAADGGTKTAAIEAYAYAILAGQPDTAEQWAEKLPPGEKRDALFQRIRKAMPKGR